MQYLIFNKRNVRYTVRMRIFGRKANQQSTTTPGPDVPPELQPYYGRPSLGVRLRRIGLFVLPVVAALALIVALIAGGMWLKHRADESNHKVATNQSTTQKPATNNNQQNGTSQTENNSQSQSNGSKPSNNSTDNTNSANGSSSGSSSTSQQSENSSTNGQASSSSNIPSTGPDSSMYLIALATAIAGSAVAYARQLKIARR